MEPEPLRNSKTVSLATTPQKVKLGELIGDRQIQLSHAARRFYGGIPHRDQTFYQPSERIAARVDSRPRKPRSKDYPSSEQPSSCTPHFPTAPLKPCSDACGARTVYRLPSPLFTTTAVWGGEGKISQLQSIGLEGGSQVLLPRITPKLYTGRFFFFLRKLRQSSRSLFRTTFNAVI